MSQERLSGLAIMSINHECVSGLAIMSINHAVGKHMSYDDIIDDFASRKCRRGIF